MSDATKKTMPPLLERLDGYAEIPDMAWNVQHDIAEAAKVIREVTAQRDSLAAEACWMMDRCHACGHRLRLTASGCPQCNANAVADWELPAEYPDICKCDRCVKARSALAALGTTEGGA